MALTPKGYWYGDTNTPTLADGGGTTGDSYFIATSGTQDLGSGSFSYTAGNTLIYIAAGKWIQYAVNYTEDFSAIYNPVIPYLLSTTTGIDGTTIATTTLYTVPTGKTTIIIRAIIRVITATAIVTPPTLGIGIAAGEADIFASTALTGLNAVTKVYTFNAVGTYIAGQSTNVIKLGIDTGATAGAMVIAIDLFGYNL